MKKLMSNSEYHSNEAIGSTLLKGIHSKTVLHAINKKFEETPSLILGSATHAAILEPETFKKEYAVAPKVDRRTKEGKAMWASFVAESNGKTVLTEDQSLVVDSISHSVLSHPVAKKVLTGGESESSYFAQDEKTGLMLKCRPDYVNGGALIDLKTTRDASFEGFSKQIGQLGYHLQAAFYLDVFNKANGTDFKDFFFVAVENVAPYGVAVYQLDEAHIDAGRAAYRAALDQYAEYLEAKLNDNDIDVLYGYPCEIQKIQVPYYFLDQIKAV
ncbi:MAG: hypothetical protein CME63_01650 [Halobacteriovoraceae bacterium]|nr:hypothetical protein [Halobacteriovoraceae bacterium]